jgi:putative membrane protein
MLLIPFNFDPAWFPGLGDSWEAAHLAARDVTIGKTIAAYAVIQAAVFVAVFLITCIPAVSAAGHAAPRAPRPGAPRRAAAVPRPRPAHDRGTAPAS